MQTMNNINPESPQTSLNEIHHHFLDTTSHQSSSHDDFLEQMLSSLSAPDDHHHHFHHHQQHFQQQQLPPIDQIALASKFRSHQIAPPPKPPLLHHNNNNDLFNSNNNAGFPSPSPNHFHPPNPQANQTFGGSAAINQTPAPSGSSGGAQVAPARVRVRARRGQATDPHSIAERLRRERIAERMKALQELVPNANKTDKASMLDEIIDYVKFLQLQVKVLSMSRLGGAAAVAPLVADMSSEGGEINGAHRRSGSIGNNNNSQTGPNDSMSVTEHQVAKLMEEDMGSAMQYLQGKGLCLMPISLATAISTATCHPRSNPMISNNNVNPLVGPIDGGPVDGPNSPNMSVLTVQSAMAGNGLSDGKDGVSISKP